MLFVNLRKYRVVFICVLCGVIIATLIVNTVVSVSAIPSNRYTIVIDAGHGGVDCGVIGASGATKESSVNLMYGLCLGAYFESVNFNVVYTRKDENGLYSEFASNKKRDDMKKREKIIKNANANLVISIHQNGFTLPDQRGITAFYKIGDERSETLAKSIQSRFQKNIEYARGEALAGDYYILNCSNTLSVLIECGFLTNPDEEQLLLNSEYMNKVCHEIFSGCLSYFIETKSM